MTENTANTKPDEDIFEDSEGRNTKHKIVRGMRNETVLNSLSKVATFAAGPLFGAGVVAGVMNFVGHAGTAAIAATAGHAAVAATAGTGMAGALATGATTGTAIMAGLGVVGATAIGIMAIGALFIGVAVAADYISSRIYQDKMLDMQEFNAKRAGHHIVNELKAQNMCLTTEHESPCQQNKNWVATVGGAKPQQQAEWAVRLEAGQQTATTGRA